MTGIAAIGVNDEKDVVDYSTDRLDSDLAIFTTIVRLLQCGIREDARGIFEAEATFVKVAPALGFVPLEEHRRNRMYALSVVRSSPERPATPALLKPRCGRASRRPNSSSSAAFVAAPWAERARSCGTGRQGLAARGDEHDQCPFIANFIAAQM